MSATEEDRARQRLVEAQAQVAKGNTTAALTSLDAVIGQATGWLADAAKFTKGDVLRDLGRGDEAFALWESVCAAGVNRDDSSSPDPTLVLKARVAKARELVIQNKMHEAIEVTEPLVVWLRAESRPAVRADLIWLSDLVVGLLVTKRRYEESLLLARVVLDEVGDPNDPNTITPVTSIRLMHAIALSNLGDYGKAKVLFEDLAAGGEPAVAVLDEWIEGVARTLGPNDPQIASALLMKASALAGLGRRSDAVATVEDLIGRFSGDELPVNKAAVEKAQEMRDAMTASER